ncbi:hypothetical protein NO932_18980 [Pelagibacterium sp. 26DY04]|uniref:hypothetical protein n=1 Tax=Pelagibacterium sp. 26DY04 TaxID=2967130 RepID=UPI002814E388|nr:hypothetical protein [Pelagibacterium sp. 26DY04]WMT86949.1 hypothetical protein NO932_18980 [Pelagibacterium sp. 26DY04]
MSTKLPPQTAKDMFKTERDKDETSETKRALERSATHRERRDGDEPETGKDKLERAAEQNDRRNKDNG